MAFYNGVTVLVEKERATDVTCLEFSEAFDIDKMLLGGSTFLLVLDETEKSRHIYCHKKTEKSWMSVQLKETTLPNDLPNT